MSTLIGALRVSLGLDSAAFEKGASEIEKRSKSMQRSMQAFGKRMSSLGTTLSLAVTGPLAALGASVTGLAGKAKDLRNAAQLTGEGFEDFQRHAHAAETVGVGFEKLSDILKDTQDKIGDFAATGGGEMADFFENIATKVGVTVDSFKKLSGKDALQLYYNSLEKAGVSQKEMVFYMEAVADKGAALIPLLRENGKAMDEIGSKAAVIGSDDAKGLAEYTAAQKRLGEAFETLQIALAKSGIIDVLTAMVDKLAGAAEWFSTLSPGAQKFGVIIGTIAAAAGPALIILGQMASSFGALVPIFAKLAPVIGLVSKAMLGLLANPVILAAAAVIGGIVLAWQNWDKIKPIIDRLTAAVTEWWKDNVQPIFTAVGEKIKAVIDWHMNLYRGVADAVSRAYSAVREWLSEKLGAIWNGIKWAVGAYVDLWTSLPGKAIEAVTALYRGVKRWIVDKLNAIWDGAKEKIEGIKKSFFDLYDAVVGNSYIPDMVHGIAMEMLKLDGVMVKPAEAAAEAVKRTFAEAADATIAAFDRMAGALKGGGFLDILSSVVSLGLQLGSIGLFGKKISANINATNVPAYAGGTNFHPGGWAMVGERGPELVNLPRGAAVHPNGAAPMTQVRIVPSPYFDAVVDGRVAQAAPAIAVAGGRIGEARVRRGEEWRLR